MMESRPSAWLVCCAAAVVWVLLLLPLLLDFAPLTSRGRPRSMLLQQQHQSSDVCVYPQKQRSFQKHQQQPQQLQCQPLCGLQQLLQRLCLQRQEGLRDRVGGRLYSARLLLLAEAAQLRAQKDLVPAGDEGNSSAAAAAAEKKDAVFKSEEEVAAAAAEKEPVDAVCSAAEVRAESQQRREDSKSQQEQEEEGEGTLQQQQKKEKHVLLKGTEIINGPSATVLPVPLLPTSRSVFSGGRNSPPADKESAAVSSPTAADSNAAANSNAAAGGVIASKTAATGLPFPLVPVKSHPSLLGEKALHSSMAGAPVAVVSAAGKPGGASSHRSYSKAQQQQQPQQHQQKQQEKQPSTKQQQQHQKHPHSSVVEREAAGDVTEAEIRSAGAADGSSWLDTAAGVDRRAKVSSQEGPAAASRHNGLLWSLLWPAAAFPVWVAMRVSGLLEVLAVVAAAVMQLAPLPTALRMRAYRSTGEVQGLPFLLLLFSASLWLAYGLLKLDLVLLLPNVTGVVLSCWYLHIFLQFCDRPSFKDEGCHDCCSGSSSGSSSPSWSEVMVKMPQALKEKKQRMQIYCHGAGCLLVACGICFAAAAGIARPTYVVGLTAAAVNVLTYAAPLSAMRRVLRTRSTACMPFEVAVGNWICSGLWLFYGWLSEDLFILMPNLLGTIVGVVQVILLMKFPPSSRRYLSSLGEAASATCSSALNNAATHGASCTPCAESSYLLAAVQAEAAAADLTSADDGSFRAAGGGSSISSVAAPACATARMLPRAAALAGGHVWGSLLPGDLYNNRNSSPCAACPPSSSFHHDEQGGGVAAETQDRAWQTIEQHDSDTQKKSVRSSNKASTTTFYGGRSTSTSGRISKGGVDPSCTAKTAEDSDHPDYNWKKLHSVSPRQNSTTSNGPTGYSSRCNSSVCGLDAPSLPTHEVLLRDWQQRLREDEALTAGASAATCVAMATEGARIPSS